MTRLFHVGAVVLFIALGIAILAGWIAPGLPEGSGMRPMLGLVTILFGLYRGVLYFLVPPQERRPYGGSRRRIKLDSRDTDASPQSTDASPQSDETNDS